MIVMRAYKIMSKIMLNISSTLYLSHYQIHAETRITLAISHKVVNWNTAVK